MKKITLLFCLFITSYAFAQNNLQFSRAILINITGTHSASSAAATFVFKDTTITVPAGTVWKLESANVTLQNPNPNPTIDPRQIIESSYYIGTYLLLNNKIISQKTHKVSGSGGDFSDINLGFSFPIWLPSGTYPIRLLFQCDAYSFSNAINVAGYGGISILEFNIVQ